MFSHKGVEKIRPGTLLKEAKRLFKKKKRRLDEESRKIVEQMIAGLEAELKTGGAEEIRRAKEKLYEAVTGYIPRTGVDVFKDYVRALVIALFIGLLVRQFVIEPFRIPTGSMIPTLKIGDKILVTKFTYGLNIPFTNVKIFDFNKPDRWDVVVFTTSNIRDSSSIDKNFVKRVVGLPGETIEIRDGEIYKYEYDENGREVVKHIVKPDYLKDEEPQYCEYQNVDEDKTSTIELYDAKKILGIFPINVSNGESRMVRWKYGRVGQRIKVPPGHYFVLGDNSRDSFDSRGWGFVPFENIRGKVICKWKFRPPWGDGFIR